MKKIVLLLLCLCLAIVPLTACGGGRDTEHGDPNANSTVPEGSLTLTIEKNSSGNQIYGVGVELDPHFLHGNVGRTGVSNGVSWTCQEEDWNNIFLPRMAEMNLKRIRVMLLHPWFVSSEQDYRVKNYTWDSLEMRSLYQTLDAAQANGMDVCLVLWGASDWLKDGSQWVDIPKDDEAFCVLFADAVDYLINTKGYTCINEITPFNEPNALYGALGTPAGVNAYIALCERLDELFKERGLREKVKFNLSDDARSSSWLTATLENLQGVYDVVNSHTYDFTAADTNEEIINSHHYKLSNYTDSVKEYGATHIFGEFGTGSTSGSHSAGDKFEPSRGLQVARIALNMLQSGSCGFSYWVLFSQYYSSAASESIMDMGLWGFADEGYNCRPVYYAYSLLTRYAQKGMEIYLVPTVDPNLVAVALRSGDDWTYLVVNDSETESKEVSFLNHTKFPGAMKRYVYDQNNVPTDNKVIASNGTVTPDGRVLTDTLAPLTFTVYTTL